MYQVAGSISELFGLLEVWIEGDAHMPLRVLVPDRAPKISTPIRTRTA